MAGKAKLFDSNCNISSNVNRNADRFQSRSSDNSLRFKSPSKAQHTETQDQIGRCFNKLRSLRPSDNPTLKTELNSLFDQLISENYTNITHDNIPTQVRFSFVRFSKCVKLRLMRLTSAVRSVIIQACYTLKLSSRSACH